jgi:hypothetical protein
MYYRTTDRGPGVSVGSSRPAFVHPVVSNQQVACATGLLSSGSIHPGRLIAPA